MCILIAYVPTSQAQPAQAKLAAQRPVPRQVCAGDLSRDGMIPSGPRKYAGKEHCHNQVLVSWHLDPGSWVEIGSSLLRDWGVHSLFFFQHVFIDF